MGRSLTLSYAFIKLRSQHLLEWDALATIQKKVLKLVKEETAQKLSFYCDDKLACLNLKREQSERLMKIMVSQREERQQMKTRHRQEIALLEQGRGASEQILTETLPDHRQTVNQENKR